MFFAMISTTSSGTEIRLASTFFLRIAERVLKVWGLEIHVESALESASQPVIQLLKLGDRSVAGEDHLLICVIKGIEGVEELFLYAELFLEKMDIVDEEYVSIAILVLEKLRRFFLDRLYELVRKFFSGDADDLGLRVFGPDAIAYGLHEVRFFLGLLRRK